MTVLSSGGVSSLDRSSAASNDSGVLSGDWGNVVCDTQVAVLSHRAVQVRRLLIFAILLIFEANACVYESVCVWNSFLTYPGVVQSPD